MPISRTQGFCGAGDSNSFKAFVSQQNNSYNQHYVGTIPDITYEGVFQEHFYTQKPTDQIVNIEAQFGVTKNFLNNQQKQLWAACFIQSKLDGQKRDADLNIDLSLVLDISGSMSSGLSYNSKVSKQALAKQGIKDIISKCLKQNDRVCLSTFNTQSQEVFNFTQRQQLNLDNTYQLIDNIKIGGGTTLTAGLTAGIKQLEDLIKNEQKNPQKNSQKRVLFLTDMLSLDAIELQQLIESGIKQQIYFSIIGIGVDFDNQITDIISKYEGCNYFSLTKDEEVQETLVESFDYNFFPFAYNVDLMMQNSNYEVQEVYGIPFQTTQNKDLGDNYKQFTAVTEINTLFPSKFIGVDQKKGGLILIKLKEKNSDNQAKQLKFVLNYTLQPNKNSQFYQKEVVLDLNILQSDELQQQQNQQSQIVLYQNLNVLKGIILQNYVQFIKEIKKYVEENRNQNLSKEQCQIYKQRFSKFSAEFKQNIQKYFEDNLDMQEVIQSLDNFLKIVDNFFNSE